MKRQAEKEQFFVHSLKKRSRKTSTKRVQDLMRQTLKRTGAPSAGRVGEAKRPDKSALGLAKEWRRREYKRLQEAVFWAGLLSSTKGARRFKNAHQTKLVMWVAMMWVAKAPGQPFVRPNETLLSLHFVTTNSRLREFCWPWTIDIQHFAKW